VRAVAGSRRIRSLLGSLLTTTAADGIEALFESEALRGVFAGTGAILAPLTVDGSAIALLAASMIHHHGAARPVGGMGGLVAALQRCFEAHGGQVLLSSKVAGIRMNSRAGGVVELTDGTVIHAERAVIAACPVQRLPDMVGDALPVDIAERLRHAPANSTGLGTFTINAALSGRVELPHHQANRRTSTFAGLRSIWALSKRSLRRGSNQRAESCPIGRRSAWASCPPLMKARPRPGRTSSSSTVLRRAPRRRVGQVAREAERRLLDKVSEAAPDFVSLQIGNFVETAEDLADRTGAENGCIYHIDNLPTRIGPLRPAAGAGGYRTPVPDLYLGSASCHPGGGVSGLPGKHCATAVLDDLRGGRGFLSRIRTSLT